MNFKIKTNPKASRQRVANYRKTTWEENLDDPTRNAPYGIRWGRTAKGSTTHIMEWNAYRTRWNARCNRAYDADVKFANVYLKAKACKSCTTYLRSNLNLAFTGDWNHYTDPVTGRTKRERHN